MQDNDKEAKLRYKELSVESDHELLIWEKWIRIRKEETTNLSKTVNKPPVDLTMNLLWKVREDKERKTALEHAQIVKQPTVRGTLWTQAPRLKQGCYCKPVYEIQRTPAELGRPTVIEHIGVPKYIQETEMGMSGVPERKPCLQLNSKYEKYREKREYELKHKIRKIDPFRPSISQLVIKGTKPKTPPPVMPPLPVISITPPNYQEEKIPAVYALRINNTVIWKDIPGQTLTHLQTLKNETWHEDCRSWTYYFNTPINRACRSKLFLQNLGTVTLRYCWKKIKRSIPFIPEDLYDQVFYFNKNEDVLSPGQSKNICFTFISESSGIYSEFWELSFCNICFFDNLADKLIINLYADSVQDSENIKRKIDILKTRIDVKAINNTVRRLLNEILDKAFATVPQIYPYKKLFLEAEFFEMKNPVCFYHQTEVAKMKEVYAEMVPGEVWDLSIATWREKMKDKDYEDRMKYYELLRMFHSDFLKPWYEGEKLQEQKHREVKLLLVGLANQFDAEYNRISEKYLTKSKVESYKTSMKSASRALQSSMSIVTIDPKAIPEIHNLFYLHAYEHVATTIELCAGVLSSLDLNRWIEFDFCRH